MRYLIPITLLTLLTLALPLSLRPVSHAANCTLVLGGSPTTYWFSLYDHSFEAQAGIVDREWESVTEGRTTVTAMAYEEDRVWDEWAADNIDSRCTANDRLPDNVIYHFANHWRNNQDFDYNVTALLEVVERIRTRINPNATIYLMPMIASTDPGCSTWSAENSAATEAYIDAAVAVDPTLIKTLTPAIRCNQFSGDAHLTEAGALNAGAQIADWWNGLGPQPTPTPAPVPTATPVPMLVSCERVATYSDGSEQRVALPLADCN